MPACAQLRQPYTRAAGLSAEQAEEASTAISALPTVGFAGVTCLVSPLPHALAPPMPLCVRARAWCSWRLLQLARAGSDIVRSCLCVLPGAQFQGLALWKRRL